jgi:hypothetical protein
LRKNQKILANSLSIVILLMFILLFFAYGKMTFAKYSQTAEKKFLFFLIVWYFCGSCNIFCGCDYGFFLSQNGASKLFVCSRG